MLCLATQLCPTLCDTVDCSPPGSSVHGILQARILECVAFPFSRGIFPTQESNWGLLHCRQILKNKKHFSFSPRTLLNNVFTILFHYFLLFYRQLHNSTFPKLLIFLSKELFQVPFTIFHGIKIFPIKKIL